MIAAVDGGLGFEALWFGCWAFIFGFPLARWLWVSSRERDE